MSNEEQARDLVLLDRCLTKLAVSTDESLQGAVHDILAPVLNKLGSTNDSSVKKKAIEVILTIQGLIKEKKELLLPLDEVVASFRETPGSRAFALVFINMALERIEQGAAVKALPDLLLGISSVAPAQQQGLLRAVVGFLALLPSNRDLASDQRWKTLLLDHEGDKKVLLAWFLKLLLLPSVTEAERLELTVQDKRPLVWSTPDGLGKCKEGIMRLLDVVELFPKTEDVWQHFLVALGDSVVQERAATAIMRRRVDREVPEMMSAALALLERSAPPVPFGIREAVIGQLCKSQVVSQPPLLGRTLKVAVDALFSEENRLKSRGIQLLRWMLQHIQGEHLSPFAMGLVAGILQLLAKQLAIPANDTLREGSYTVIGAVIRACPGPFRSNLSIPTALAATLARESQQSVVRDALRMALYEMSSAYSSGVESATVVNFLKSLASSPSPDVRSVAGRWCKEALPFSNAHARAIALSLSEDDHLSVSREARQALNATVDYPSFSDMIDAVLELTPTVDDAAPPSWHDPAIKFLWRCLPRPEQLLEFPPSVLQRWDGLLWRAMERGRVTSALPVVACQHLVQSLSLDPRRMLAATQDAWIESRWEATALNAYGGTVRADGRPVFATLAAIVHAALSPSNAKLVSAVQATSGKLSLLCSGATPAPMERVAAAAQFWGLLSSVHPDRSTQASVWDQLVKLLRSTQEPVIVSAALAALSDMARRGCVTGGLELACEVLGEKLARSERVVAEGAVQLIGAVALGCNLSLDQRETAITSLLKWCPSSSHGEISWVSGEVLSILFAGWGSDCVHLGPFAAWKWFDGDRTSTVLLDLIRPSLLRVYREPMSSGNIKQRECVAVWLCSLLRFCPSLMKPHLSHMMQALSVLLADPSAVTRECASRGLLYAWNEGGEEEKSLLLSGLVRDFGTASASKPKYDREIFPDDALRVPKAPTATPAAASGSLSAAEQKKKDAASGDSKESFRQLAGAAKGVDASLTPSLMSLAGDSSVLGGRASAFASDDNRLIRAARAQLLPFLPRMFPVLFRGQFWPEVYVARSFRRVLRALCIPPADDGSVFGSEEEKPAKRTKGAELTLSGLLTQYLEPTCALLVSSARDRDAEVREAAMAALPDVLAGRSWRELSDVFEPLWKMVLGGMDDMRDGVRVAASQALSSLSSFSARLVDLTHTPAPDSTLALKIVIEMLLEHGIGSPAKEVQSKSVVVLKAMVSAAGASIEPHVADLLEKLLHCASALEPEMVSYLSQQQNIGISSEDLHKARAAMSRMTPLGECVDMCLKHVTTETVLPVVKSIESGLSGAGLPTLLQSAWAVTSLSRGGAALDVLKGKPATALTLSLLNVMSKQTSNASAYKELCTAIASVAAFSSEKLWAAKIVPLINDNYFALGDENSRFFSGCLLQALSADNRSSEVLRGRLKDFIGVVFVGKHDSEKRVRSLFGDVFVSVGAPSAVGLYNQEILDSLLLHSESNNWQVRRQCYRALAALASSLTGGRERAIAACLKEAQGKHWKGKGSLLQALATLISVVVATAGSHDQMVVASASALCEEMTKKGPTRSQKYKSHAAKALCSIVRETSTILTPAAKEQLWKGLWPVPLEGLLLGHANDKAYISLHELGFAVVAYAMVGNAPDVLKTIIHGITGQSAWEVRVSALAALETMLRVRTEWTPMDLEFGANLLLFCLADKFVAVRERCATIICSVPFPPGMRACITDAKLAMCTQHQETKRAFDFLALNK